MTAPFTRPPDSRSDDHRQWEKDRMRYIQEQERNVSESRINVFFKWCTTVFGALFTAGLIWMVSTLVNVDKNTALLLARPEPVSKVQHDIDLAELKSEISAVRSDVKDVRNSQIDTKNSWNAHHE